MGISVSVCMTTYNQEKYIVEAIESVLTQKTNFPMQLIIGDDCSTDNTLEICKSYTAKYPNMLVLKTVSNVGLAKNLAMVWGKCTGKYIAIIEGDDYWRTQHKLQTQVDFMESHTECSMCFTKAEVFNERINKINSYPYSTKLEYAVSDIIKYNSIINCSVMYRAGLVKELPRWMLELPYCDLALHCLHLLHGTAGYIAKSMAAHRIHDNNMFESRSLADRLTMSTKVYIALANNLPYPYCEQAKQVLALTYQWLALLTVTNTNLSHILSWPLVITEGLIRFARRRK
jgi:glycosyltransferase involved in cell wall biosynthesis